jgi:uncharacterized repeat protein (TIGR03847 family)
VTVAEIVEIRGPDLFAVGAVGPPGKRVFMIQAGNGVDELAVIVEKEQVALLAAEASQFLDHLAEDYPEERQLVDPADSTLSSPPEPLFRARLIGLGFDPDSHLVLVELREEAPEDDEEAENPEDVEGWIARVFATRAQLRALIGIGVDAVLSGRTRWN